MTTPKNRKKKSSSGSRGDTRNTEATSFRESWWWIWGVRLSIALLLLIFLGGGLLVGGYLYFAQGLPDYRSLSDYQPPQITRILARDGTLIGEMYEDRRTLVSREEIPEVLVQAILSAEDAAFYEHEGLDYFGMLRAFYNAVRAGRVKGGGSTITQQTVKNLLLTPEKSLERKARELILARRLESHLSKDDILTIYMNAIYFGHQRYGVQEACRFYFGRDVSQINLNQAAILAGLIQSPERHSPMKHPDSARTRREYVLNQMVDNGFISETLATKTGQLGLELRTQSLTLSTDNQHFVDEVDSSSKSTVKRRSRPLDIPFGQHWIYSDNRKQSPRFEMDSKPWISAEIWSSPTTIEAQGNEYLARKAVSGAERKTTEFWKPV